LRMYLKRKMPTWYHNINNTTMQSNYNNEHIRHLDPFTTFLKTNWISYAITLMFLKTFQKFIGYWKSHYVHQYFL
jgi:hypothetical protein